MTYSELTSANTRLVTVSGEGLAHGNRVAVPSSRVPGETGGLIFPHGTGAGVPVRLVPVRELPSEVIVVSSAMSAAHGLAEDDWRLQPSQAETVASVELETPAAVSLTDAVTAVQRSPLLCGHVFSAGTAGVRDSWIELDGLSFRVRSATGKNGAAADGLARIGSESLVSVFAGGASSGVDIVILADRSGSMGVNDIQIMTEGRGFLRSSQTTAMTRMQALKRALKRMIDIRAGLDGVVTRFALIGFDDRTHALYPTGGGMTEISGAADVRSLESLREAVALLREDNHVTDIGNALHKAGELLHRHGVHGNDRLIVLVSDGAHWAPLSDERSGESVAGVNDPVSLMEDLHANLGIRLHAVGISDKTTFQRWWDRQSRQPPPEALVPNHDLLSQLVQVTGGDRHRIGGMEVLEEYFEELGSGVVRSVGRPASARLPSLQIDPASIPVRPRESVSDTARRKAWEAEVELTLGVFGELSDASMARLGFRLYQSDPADNMRLRKHASCGADFKSWVLVAYKSFHERLHEDYRHARSQAKRGNLVVPEVAAVFWDGRIGNVWGLRNYFAHEPENKKDPAGKKDIAEENRRVGEVFRAYTGDYYFTEDDAEGWSTLQRGLLGDIRAMLTDMGVVLRSGPAVEPELAAVTGPITQGFD